MKTQISIGHLVRHFLLFALTVLFLLTLVRAGLNLWQLNHVEDLQTLIRSFVQGIRFDIATVGMLLLLPVVIVPLLAMTRPTLGLARVLSPLWMILALLLVLLLELVTPYFLHSASLRPDLAALGDLQGMASQLTNLSTGFWIPAVLGTILLLMLLYAFWARMEIGRFLRYPVRILPALLCSLLGFVICLVAIRSGINPEVPALGPDAALISDDVMVNEIALNSTFKTLHHAYSSSDALQSVFKMPDLSAVTELLPN